jgi:hypothetical protein
LNDSLSPKKIGDGNHLLQCRQRIEISIVLDICHTSEGKLCLTLNGYDMPLQSSVVIILLKTEKSYPQIFPYQARAQGLGCGQFLGVGEYIGLWTMSTFMACSFWVIRLAVWPLRLKDPKASAAATNLGPAQQAQMTSRL